jgi:hypothetical protein
VTGRRVLAAVAAVVCLLPAAARAQQAAKPSLRLASQTPWVGRGDPFAMRVLIDEAGRSGLELTVAVHRQVTSRIDFQRTLEGKIQGSAFKSTSRPLAQLERDAGGAYNVLLGVQDPDQPRDDSLLSLRAPGVYPVRVELSEGGGGRVLTSLVSHIVYLPDPIDGPRLEVAWVVPVHAPPGVQPGGGRRVPASVSADLATLAAQLEQRPNLPLTLAPTPETVESLAASNRAADRQTIELLARAARAPGHQVLTGPYVPVSPAATTGLLEQEGTAQVTTGTEVLGKVLQTSPDPTARVLSGPVTEALLGRLRDQQVERVVVPDGELVPIPTQQVTPAQPFELGARQGRRVLAASADSALAAHFRAGQDAVLAAHHLLADLAVIYFDFPGRPRGVVVVPPDGWRPSAAFLTSWLDGLTTGPILGAATLDQFFAVPPATAGRNRNLVRTLRTTGAGPALPVESILAARRHLDAFGGILGPNEPVFERLERTLLVAEGSQLRGAVRARYLRGVTTQITTELGRIHAPAQRSITLTARRGRIPVTIEKEVPYPVHLVIRVASDQLRFPSGSRREVELTRRNTTELFTVQARTSGAFPLRVTLESPDGRLLLSTSRFTVRSTAASGLGVILSVGAGVVLLGWWARSLGRRRRERRAG